MEELLWRNCVVSDCDLFQVEDFRWVLENV